MQQLNHELAENLQYDSPDFPLRAMQGRLQNYPNSVMIIAISGISAPSFWLGLMLIQLFSVKLGWLPVAGLTTWKSYILPSFTMGCGVMGFRRSRRSAKPYCALQNSSPARYSPSAGISSPAPFVTRFTAWPAAAASRSASPIQALAVMDEIEADERALLQLAYGELPLQDAGAVPFETMRSFARHALALRRESPFCRSVPEDIFLHFVFCPRVNSEDLTDCRPFFFDRLLPRVRSLSAEQAILEVNRWCAENMTYRASDDRTQNPMTSYNCGLGRCGEESTFAVTALRSVGIPARQIYAPLWAHCDDNHGERRERGLRAPRRAAGAAFYRRVYGAACDGDLKPL